MASGDQLKALLQSHLESDDTRFMAIVMQVAAHEARRGHGKLAQELRTIVDSSRTTRSTASVTPLARPRGELSSMFSVSYPQERVNDIILAEDTQERLLRILKEQRHLAKIRSHGLAPRRRLLLLGPPGTGKTMSASVLAGELSLPLFVVRLDTLITKFMGESAAKLRLIFDAMTETRAVYFFDEFDSIGAHRSQGGDVGEIRRVLNSFLQFIEQDASDSLILAATNHPNLLDTALFRRFDDVIDYPLPTEELVQKTLECRLAGFPKVQKLVWKQLVELGIGLSYADLSRACEEALKDAVLEDRKLRQDDVAKQLRDRKARRRG